MTDERPEPTPDDVLREEAKEAVQTPAEPVPGAEALPGDVPDGRVPTDDDPTPGVGDDD